MNLRPYVRARGRSGVFFFTLEAARWLALLGARALYQLPYRHATMHVAKDAGWIWYGSRRTLGNAESVAQYRATGPGFHPRPGTLEYFLTERYALYSVLPGGGLFQGDIHHAPWSLQPAQAPCPDA